MRIARKLALLGLRARGNPASSRSSGRFLSQAVPETVRMLRSTRWLVVWQRRGHVRVNPLGDQPQAGRVLQRELDGAHRTGEPGVVLGDAQAAQQAPDFLGGKLRRHWQITSRIRWKW